MTVNDNRSLWFWDWKSGHKTHTFQWSQTSVQPGSLDSEAGIYALLRHDWFGACNLGSQQNN